MPTTYQSGMTEKHPGAEPLPGYRLLRPLGRGGFGEVWKCEAPGGFQKAIKFVAAGGDQFRQEQAAVEQIKAIRHPFLLTLERVELVGEELVMVMELADCQLQDRVRQCRALGHPGIPREELLGYLREAAEALDMMGARFGLQHLDVKPENLFLVAGHLKVGDYGLVRRTQRAAAGEETTHGFTPRYTAPEVLRGRVDPRSDQYSLALVYAELLSGTFPYSGKTAQQLMVQHLGTPPDLAAIPPADRPVVARAMAKDPAGRYPSSTAFVRALAGTPDLSPAPGGEPVPPPDRPDTLADEATPSQSDTPTAPMRGGAETPPAPPAAEPPSAVFGDAARPSSWEAGPARGPGRSGPRRKEPPRPVDPFAGLRPVMWVDQFRGSPGADGVPPGVSAPEFVSAVVRAAAETRRTRIAEAPPPERSPPCQFLSTFPAAMVPLKLALVAEHWGMTVHEPDPYRIVLWREAPVEPPKAAKGEPRPVPPRTGFEITILRPTPPSAEYTAGGAVCGAPADAFTVRAWGELPEILADVRGHLQNLAERRAHPRIRAAFPVRVYPLYQDGVVGPPVTGESVDVSAGGIRFRTPDAVRTARLYIEFPEVRPLAGQAVYVRVLRDWQEPGGRATVTVGRFSGGGG
ncbi:MAG TPA: protein kinase [Urbifossiella sp.]|jgi:serine/threonine protein kinase|nr:protein kinase [Urbifossiella sp.]